MNITFPELRNAVLKELPGLGHADLVKNCQYNANKAELISYLREYIFRSDAKTNEFMTRVSTKLELELSGVAMKRDQMIALIMDDFKRRLEKSIPQDAALGTEGANHLHNMLQNNYGGHANEAAATQWRDIIGLAKTMKDTVATSPK